MASVETRAIGPKVSQQIITLDVSLFHLINATKRCVWLELALLSEHLTCDFDGALVLSNSSKDLSDLLFSSCSQELHFAGVFVSKIKFVI